MKLFFTLAVTVFLFAVVVILGLKNQELVNINYLVAQSEMRLSTLFAVIFLIGFVVSSLIGTFFYMKLKMKNRKLRKLNKKQRKELNQLRTLPVKA
ncbi:LapA family protein [Psychromonas aquimarina]|uniref:LapA family protein n=1 Tax=Psychromonas aquimarina TaxID=444919 RepID=UPI0003F75CA1|nr:lipopolysaccharide assembly protein LapA domain-containing protein [Psychromonas aquimarina]